MVASSRNSSSSASSRGWTSFETSPTTQAGHPPGIMRHQGRRCRPSTTLASEPSHWVREHRLFCSLLAVAALLRVIAMLGYQPALWYPDSLEYVEHAVHIAADPIRSNGYPFLLDLFELFHSVALVAFAQHAMGLAMGVALYSLLWHRYKLPKWACTLAAVPPLLSVYAIQLEHFILSDTAFALLITIAVVLVLWRPNQRSGRVHWPGCS